MGGRWREDSWHARWRGHVQNISGWTSPLLDEQVGDGGGLAEEETRAAHSSYRRQRMGG